MMHYVDRRRDTRAQKKGPLYDEITVMFSMFSMIRHDLYASYTSYLCFINCISFPTTPNLVIISFVTKHTVTLTQILIRAKFATLILFFFGGGEREIAS